MDIERMRELFQRQLESGLPEEAVLPDGSTVIVNRTNMRADVTAAQYGMGSGYSCSILMAYREGLPLKDGSITLNGRHYVILGRRDFGGGSVQLDLREGV